MLTINGPHHFAYREYCKWFSLQLFVHFTQWFCRFDVCCLAFWGGQAGRSGACAVGWLLQAAPPAASRRPSLRAPGSSVRKKREREGRKGKKGEKWGEMTLANTKNGEEDKGSRTIMIETMTWAKESKSLRWKRIMKSGRGEWDNKGREGRGRDRKKQNTKNQTPCRVQNTNLIQLQSRNRYYYKLIISLL